MSGEKRRLTKVERDALFLAPYAGWRFTGDAVRGYTCVGVSYRGQVEALRHTTKTAIPALLAQLDAADEEITLLSECRDRDTSNLAAFSNEVERLRAALPDADNLDVLAEFLDKTFPFDPNPEVQRDLRRWASLIRECGGDND